MKTVVDYVNCHYILHHSINIAPIYPLYDWSLRCTRANDPGLHMHILSILELKHPPTRSRVPKRKRSTAVIVAVEWTTTKSLVCSPVGWFAVVQKRE